MSFSTILALGGLIVVNLGLIWLLLAAPAGRRTVTVSRLFAAPASKLWSALHPHGANALWDGNLKSVTPLDGSRTELEINWDGRDGKPIRRTVEFFDEQMHQSFTLRTVDDTSLDSSFWVNHSETIHLQSEGEGTRVTVSETDNYKGFAFLWFRYFKNRRMLEALDGWVRTGEYRSVALFEKLPVQIGMGLLSALLLWPFFGLTVSGLVLCLTLTVVVALHEAGHMFAFRVMGHRKVRMIFIPLLGGIALGGRPYDRHFEVAFSALMGAGFSAFAVGAAMAMYHPLNSNGYVLSASAVGAFATIAAIFNLANLVPMWKFDGGQVIRQVFTGRLGQGVAAFVLLGGLLLVCSLSGFSTQALLIVGAVFAVLSLVTNGASFKPKAALHPMSQSERVLIMAGLVATFAVHAAGTVWGLTYYL